MKLIFEVLMHCLKIKLMYSKNNSRFKLIKGANSCKLTHLYLLSTLDVCFEICAPILNTIEVKCNHRCVQR
jgi:hypothetical protein